MKRAAAALHKAAFDPFPKSTKTLVLNSGSARGATPRSAFGGAFTCDARYQWIAAMRLDKAPRKFKTGIDRAR